MSPGSGHAASKLDLRLATGPTIAMLCAAVGQISRLVYRLFSIALPGAPDRVGMRKLLALLARKAEPLTLTTKRFKFTVKQTARALAENQPCTLGSLQPGLNYGVKFMALRRGPECNRTYSLTPYPDARDELEAGCECSVLTCQSSVFELQPNRLQQSMQAALDSLRQNEEDYQRFQVFLRDFDLTEEDLQEEDVQVEAIEYQGPLAVIGCEAAARRFLSTPAGKDQDATEPVHYLDMRRRFGISPLAVVSGGRCRTVEQGAWTISQGDWLLFPWTDRRDEVEDKTIRELSNKELMTKLPTVVFEVAADCPEDLINSALAHDALHHDATVVVEADVDSAPDESQARAADTRFAQGGNDETVVDDALDENQLPEGGTRKRRPHRRGGMNRRIRKGYETPEVWPESRALTWPVS
eukprot:TRINITY_DN19812_c0_g1_i2.p1 TRINITY_DN19812_c0_g1~~TRINITY_DN19812_c0_g1_i2.p1  ORF type:complete len:412 (+),score=65.72 TRINITY_DN19812_c0_g1_i2:81-1316(+)